MHECRVLFVLYVYFGMLNWCYGLILCIFVVWYALSVIV